MPRRRLFHCRLVTRFSARVPRRRYRCHAADIFAAADAALIAATPPCRHADADCHDVFAMPRQRFFYDASRCYAFDAAAAAFFRYCASAAPLRSAMDAVTRCR